MSKIHRIAYAVIDANSKADEAQNKARWTRVGVTFLNKDGSETVALDAIPVNARLVLRDPQNAQEDD